MKLIQGEDRLLTDVTLCLTLSEARELAESLADLIAHPEHHHCHIMADQGTEPELTLAVYTPDNLHLFAPVLRRMLAPEAVNALHQTKPAR